MAFDEKYQDWNHRRVKAIIDHLGHKFFHNKRILDLGCGKGEIAAQFSRLGADITCVDARQENLDELKKKYPHLKTVRADLDAEWPFTENFDVIFSLGLLCHLKNYEQHIENLCIFGDLIVLETEVCDSNDANMIISSFEEKAVNDLSFSGEGSILSSANIQRRLGELGATFKRMDEGKLNSAHMRYDWPEQNTGIREPHARRMWFIQRNKYLAHQFANNRATKYAEQEAQRQANEAVKQRMYPAYPQRQPAAHRAAPPYAPQPKTIGPRARFQPPPPPPAPGATPQLKCKIRLFYNYYEDKNPQRKAEIDYCLQKNIDNSLLDIIVLDSDTNPTYNFFFEKINKLAGPDDISIICNSDIFFDDTIALVENMGAKDMYALSRWDWAPNTTAVLRDIRNSQDAWIVRGKVENVNGDFKLGIPFCDNRIAFEFSKSGYNVRNPGRSIKAYHYHQTAIRHYDDKERVPGQCLFLDITAI